MDNKIQHHNHHHHHSFLDMEWNRKIKQRLNKSSLYGFVFCCCRCCCCLVVDCWLPPRYFSSWKCCLPYLSGKKTSSLIHKEKLTLWLSKYTKNNDHFRMKFFSFSSFHIFNYSWIIIIDKLCNNYIINQNDRVCVCVCFEWCDFRWNSPFSNHHHDHFFCVCDFHVPHERNNAKN